MSNVNSQRRRRSSKSDLTPDTERLDLTPFIFRKSLTGRVGCTISVKAAVTGRIRATRCRCEVTTTSSPDLTRLR